MATLEKLDPGFEGTVVRYEHMVQAALADDPDRFTYFPGVCPSWDNEARKPGRGFSIIGASPGAYGDWLEAACRRAMRTPNRQERMVFVNAWNEWAEGAHLEPDRHYGHAFLNETARVVAGLAGLIAGMQQRAEEMEAAPRSRPRRRLADMPVLVRKNLAYRAANGAERVAKALRRLV
jgi:lipopolysaccharide biosynthesis protein